MARHQTIRLSVDLFPFLSIIVCVIGVIAFLIAVLALVGSEQGEREREYTQVSASFVERQSAADRLAQMLKQSDELAEQIARVRSEIRTAEGALGDIGQLETEISGLRKKWTDLDARRDELKDLRSLLVKQQQAAKELAVLETELTQIKARTDETRKEATRATTRPGTETIRLVIPPGADKSLRPVFVECSATGLTVYPEKTFIAKAQVARSAAYRALLERVKADEKLTLNFLIRPDGVETFDEARQIARDRSLRHGYVPAPGSGRIVIADEQQGVPARPETQAERKGYYGFFYATDPTSGKKVALRPGQMTKEDVSEQAANAGIPIVTVSEGECICGDRRLFFERGKLVRGEDK
jgi:TolA-binding protein